MKLKNLIVAALFPLSAAFACGGTASDSGGDGDGDSAGDGDGDGDDFSGPSSSNDKGDVCDEFCEEISECDGVEVEECSDSCAGNTTTSQAGQEAINACFSGDLCSGEISDEDGAAAVICLLTQTAAIDPSDVAQTYCDESVDTINECLGSEPEESFGTCETSIGIASDELLAGLNACADLDCEDVEGCLQVEILKNFPLEALVGLEDGAEPSPAVLADLIAIGLVFSQLGLDDESGGIGELPVEIPMGGASGM